MVLRFPVIVSTLFMLTYKVHFWFGYLQKIKLCTWMTRWLEATPIGPRVNWYAHLLPVLSVPSHKVTWVIPSCFVHQLLGDLNGEISGLIPWTKKWLPVKKWKETKKGASPWFKVVVLVIDSEGPETYRFRCIGLVLDDT